MKYLLILIGGGLGAVLRYLTGQVVARWSGPGFPFGTFVVNLTGCLLIGLLAALFERVILPPNLRLFLIVGLLGGFTTFSSFGLETFNLLKEAEWKFVLWNVVGSNIAGIALVAAGYFGMSVVLEKLKG